jgi:ATP synthase, F1 delta subunit
MNNIALRYAESLFNLANEENQLEVFMNNLLFVGESLDDYDIINFFHHPLVELNKKIEVIEQYFEDNINQYILNFLSLLIKNNRFNLLRLVIDSFLEFYDEANGIKRGTLYTPTTLTTEEIKNIENVISKKTKVIIKLTMIIDQSLLGGLKVVIGDMVIDNSIKNRLSLLKGNLLKERVGE